MKKGRNTARIFDHDDELDYRDVPEDDRWQEKRLIIKSEPPSRRVHLIALGAIEMRCISCDEIKPLARAEESGDGWICEDCLRAMKRKVRQTRKKTRSAVI